MHQYSRSRLLAVLLLSAPLAAQTAKRPIRSEDIYCLRDCAELHGAQRHRLGSSEMDIVRESKILVAEVERAINASVDTVSTQEATRGGASDSVRDSISAAAVDAARQYALDVSFRMLDQGSRTTTSTFHFAKSADTP
ncbi:MAG: hypothetical protein M3Y30_02390 [Gemmatimonadota bacterium]|nr:hypothetical protein [Gemmatimonadota bacterium]